MPSILRLVSQRHRSIGNTGYGARMLLSLLDSTFLAAFCASLCGCAASMCHLAHASHRCTPCLRTFTPLTITACQLPLSTF